MALGVNNPEQDGFGVGYTRKRLEATHTKHTALVEAGHPHSVTVTNAPEQFSSAKQHIIYNPYRPDCDSLRVYLASGCLLGATTAPPNPRAGLLHSR